MDLFPRVLAQTLDEIASPTIPFEPPGGGSITPTPTAPQGPSISLSTQQLAINVGSTIKITVSINSKGTELGEYAFQVTYDPSLLQIVDADVSQAGSQIKVLDNTFQVQENTATQSTGIITFREKSSSITSTYTDRQVAEIELVALKEGLGQVSLNKQNSRLLDSNSTDILESVNSISVTVTKESQQITPFPTSFPSSLPDNALIDEIGTPRALMLGMLLIATGLYISDIAAVPESKEFLDERVFMNTRVRIKVISDQPTVFTLGKIDTAFDQFRYVVEKYTRFNDTSELAVLNANSGKPHKVSAEFLKLVETMLEIARLTGGAYDPTIIDLLEAYGYDKKYDFSKLDNPGLYDEIKKIAKTRPLFSDIKIDKKASTITLVKNQRLDLGSIGKGYAIDLAASVLDCFDNFIINAGGDIKAKGHNLNGELWKVGLMRTQLPNDKIKDGGVFGHVEVSNGSVAGSGGWARKVKFFHHLLNPKTGLPINEISQCFILGDDATKTDAWSTALFTMGKAGLDLLKKETKMEGMIVMADGKIYKTKGFKYTE